MGSRQEVVGSTLCYPPLSHPTHGLSLTFSKQTDSSGVSAVDSSDLNDIDVSDIYDPADSVAGGDGGRGGSGSSRRKTGRGGTQPAESNEVQNL